MEQERHKKTEFKEIFCASNGYLSSKRVLGAIIILSVIAMSITDLAYEHSISDNLKDIIEIMLFCATGLLGITSVTNIWKSNKTTNNTTNNIQQQNNNYED